MNESVTWRGHILLCNLPENDELTMELKYACMRIERLIVCLCTPEGYNPEDIYIWKYGDEYFVIGNPVLGYVNKYDYKGNIVKSTPSYNIELQYTPDLKRFHIEYKVKIPMPRVIIRIPELLMKVPLDRNNHHERFVRFVERQCIERTVHSFSSILNPVKFERLIQGNWYDYEE